MRQLKISFLKLNSQTRFDKKQQLLWVLDRSLKFIELYLYALWMRALSILHIYKCCSLRASVHTHTLNNPHMVCIIIVSITNPIRMYVFTDRYQTTRNCKQTPNHDSMYRSLRFGITKLYEPKLKSVSERERASNMNVCQASCVRVWFMRTQQVKIKMRLLSLFFALRFYSVRSCQSKQCRVQISWFRCHVKLFRDDLILIPVIYRLIHRNWTLLLFCICATEFLKKKKNRNH